MVIRSTQPTGDGGRVGGGTYKEGTKAKRKLLDLYSCNKA